MTELLSWAGVPERTPADQPAPRRAAVVATVTTTHGVSGAALRRLPAEVTGLEIRADLAGEVDPDRLRRHFSGELTYALRGSSQDRHARLLAAAGGFDVVDLEAPHDLTADLLARIPAHRRRISWHGDAAQLGDLRERLASMMRVPAKLYLLAPTATTFDEALAPLRLLAELDRCDVTGFGVGPAGVWSRVLAPWLGAPVVFAGQGAPTVDQLLTDYPFPALPPLHALYGIVGRSFNTSLFQRRFNAAFGQLGMAALFLPFTVPDEDSFGTRFWPAIGAGGFDELGLPVHGLTVMAPYKQTALDIAETASQAALAPRAVNLLLRQHGGWLATTTDGTAVVAALQAEGVPIRGRRVAVIGCGGAGRAVAAALVASGAKVTVVNRDRDRGRSAARLLGLEFVPLDEFDVTAYAVVVNATPVGSGADGLLFEVDRLAADAVVVDLVRAARPTALVTAARRHGLRSIEGQQVLERELAEQFQLMTGAAMPQVRGSLPEER